MKPNLVIAIFWIAFASISSKSTVPDVWSDRSKTTYEYLYSSSSVFGWSRCECGASLLTLSIVVVSYWKCHSPVARHIPTSSVEKSFRAPFVDGRWRTGSRMRRSPSRSALPPLGTAAWYKIPWTDSPPLSTASLDSPRLPYTGIFTQSLRLDRALLAASIATLDITPAHGSGKRWDEIVHGLHPAIS